MLVADNQLVQQPDILALQPWATARLSCLTCSSARWQCLWQKWLERTQKHSSHSLRRKNRPSSHFKFEVATKKFIFGLPSPVLPSAALLRRPSRTPLRASAPDNGRSPANDSSAALWSSHPNCRASGWRKNAAFKTGGVSVSPSMVSNSHSAICSARRSRDPHSSFHNPLSYVAAHRGSQPVKPLPQAPVALSAFASSGGTTAGRSSRSGSRQIRTFDPTLTLAAACIFRFTSRKCTSPPEMAMSVVLIATPSSSPRTRNPFRSGHVLATSKGMRAMTHPCRFAAARARP